MWPSTAVTTLFPVAAGDRMTGSVVYSSFSHLYLISVTDDTSGRSDTESVSCPAAVAAAGGNRRNGWPNPPRTSGQGGSGGGRRSGDRFECACHCPDGQLDVGA